MEEKDLKYMLLALKEANKAKVKDEVPVGCIIVKNDKIIARAHNLREKKYNALAHAEILAIDKACKKNKAWRLEDATIYITLEPCPMCAGAILQSRIKRIVYGAYDKKAGAIDSVLHTFDYPFNHHPEIEGGILQNECADILKEFFKNKRK